MFDVPKDFQYPKGVQADTHPNHLPTPYQEITEHDFWRQFNTYGVGNAQEFRQVLIGKDPRRKGRAKVDGGRDAIHRNVHIFWYADHGIAVVGPEQWDCGDVNKGEPEIIYKDRPLFFRLGCPHEYQELSATEARANGVPHFGNCYHVYKCKSCSNITAVDSSG